MVKYSKYTIYLKTPKPVKEKKHVNPMMQHIYWLVLFDVALPLELGNEMVHRIDKKMYLRFVNEYVTDFDRGETSYKVLSRRTFMIHTTIDCSLYVVIDAIKI